MLFVFLGDVSFNVFTSFTSGSLYNSTPLGVQFDIFYGKKIFFTNIGYSIYGSPSYFLNFIENGYGIYFDFIGLKTGLSLSVIYFSRTSVLGGNEKGFSSIYTLFLKKYIKIRDEYISINIKICEVFNDIGFDIFNFGFGIGMQ